MSIGGWLLTTALALTVLLIFHFVRKKLEQIITPWAHKNPWAGILFLAAAFVFCGLPPILENVSGWTMVFPPNPDWRFGFNEFDSYSDCIKERDFQSKTARAQGHPWPWETSSVGCVWVGPGKWNPPKTLLRLVNWGGSDQRLIQCYAKIKYPEKDGPHYVVLPYGEPAETEKYRCD